MSPIPQPILPFCPHTAPCPGGGVAVSFVACPIEQVKARLQVQYDSATKAYKGPIDCAIKLVRCPLLGLSGRGLRLVRPMGFCAQGLAIIALVIRVAGPE